MRFNVDQTIDHPPVITIFYGWYGYHSQSWLIYGIVLPTRWCPPVISWFINQNKYRYVYNKP